MVEQEGTAATAEGITAPEGANTPDVTIAPEGRVPQVWGNVPQRNKNFTGREELLATLRSGIAGSGQVTAVVPQPHALHGLGGVGKTLMAVEYAYRYRHTYDVVWWIPSDQQSLVKTALADLAPHLGLSPAAVSGIDDAAKDVLDALRRGTPYDKWLLVFDNADQPEDLFDIIPQDPGHVLITSRNHRWESLVEAVPVDVFRRDESVEFLIKRVRGAIDANDAGRLAEQLGDLPLALEQAGALLFERGMSASEYLEQLAERTSQLLSQGRPVEYPVPMTAAWSVSVASLSESLPEAVDLLQVCAFFGSEPIPREAVSRAPDGLRPELAGLLNDTIRLGRAVGELGRYALARLDIPGRTIQVHRLVQKLVQDELSPEDRHRIQHEVHLLLAAYDAGDPDDETTWAKYSQLVGHLRPSRIRDCRHPEVRAFAIRMFRYLSSSGDYQSAQTVAEDFIKRWSSETGPEHPDVIRVQLEQTNILRELGEYDAAAELNREVLASAEKVLEPDDEITLSALRGSAADLRAAGDFRTALERDQEALRRYEQTYGPDHGGTLRALNNLGLDYGLVSDYKRSRELHDRSYSGWTYRGTGAVKASMVNALNGLARAVRLSGDYSEACDLGEDAYAIALEALGPEHNWTLRTGKDLSIALRRQGEFERAEELAVPVQERCVRLLGLTSPDTLGAAMCLSNLWRTTGRLEEATGLVADSLARYVEVFRADHPYSLACQSNLAVLRRARGDAQEARKLNERALTGLEARLGRDHHYSLTVAVNLASDLAALHDLAAACALGEDTLRRLRALFGDDHPLTLSAAANFSADLTAVGQVERAEGLIGQTRVRYQRTLGLNHPDAVVFMEGRHLDADFDPPPI
ncbi:MAG: FxSxx-COOH system tetratricopeptide repeat protein [Actinomadura sp.]